MNKHQKLINLIYFEILNLDLFTFDIVDLSNSFLKSLANLIAFY